MRGEIPKIIDQTKDDLIRLNQSQLYLQGIDRTGAQLMPYRNENYAFFKSRMNPNLGGGTDLFLTGAFYRGWQIVADGQVIRFSSTDEKSPMLTEKYGADIFGLTDESKGEYVRGEFFRAIRNYIERTTGVKMK